MKFFVSQLVETEKIIPILEKYNVGLEVVQFANPYILDHRYEIMEEYKKELGDLYGEVDLIIHGPYADLSPGSRDNEIKRITSLRMEQAYEVANRLGAKKILYHNGYTPRTYTYIEWKESVYNYWSEFLKGKDNIPILIENVLDKDSELMVNLINRINKENFQVCIDVGHINAHSNEDISQWLNNLSDNINHIHLHNNYGNEDSHFGIHKGNMDIIKILHRLKSMNNDITVSLEVTDLNELEESLDILVREGFIELKITEKIGGLL